VVDGDAAAAGTACPQRAVEFVGVDCFLAFGASVVGLRDRAAAAFEADVPGAVRAVDEGAAVDAGVVVGVVGGLASADAVAVDGGGLQPQGWDGAA
jgi:hypothetical protein